MTLIKIGTCGGGVIWCTLHQWLPLQHLLSVTSLGGGQLMQLQQNLHVPAWHITSNDHHTSARPLLCNWWWGAHWWVIFKQVKPFTQFNRERYNWSNPVMVVLFTSDKVFLNVLLTTVLWPWLADLPWVGRLNDVWKYVWKCLPLWKTEPNTLTQ